LQGDPTLGWRVATGVDREEQLHEGLEKSSGPNGPIPCHLPPIITGEQVRTMNKSSDMSPVSRGSQIIPFLSVWPDLPFMTIPDILKLSSFADNLDLRIPRSIS
jgi:hypothetical protein